MNPGAYLGRFFSARAATGNRVNSYHQVRTVGLLSILAGAHFAAAAESGDPMAQIKGFLVFKLERMATAAHDYVSNANAYQAIIDRWAGDYDRAATNRAQNAVQVQKKMSQMLTVKQLAQNLQVDGTSADGPENHSSRQTIHEEKASWRFSSRT